MEFGDSGRGQHSWTIYEAHTGEIIKQGLDLGVDFYDTAIAYQSGTSEQYVGRGLRDFAKRGGGQMLICAGGRGYYQEWGKDPVEMKRSGRGRNRCGMAGSCVG